MSCTRQGDDPCTIGHLTLPHRPSLRDMSAGRRARNLGTSPNAKEGSRMPTYLSPGVYVEEVEAGSRPIEGVGTSVAAFVGLAAKGPVNEPTLVSNWTQFTETFGDFVESSYLAHAVYGWFLNGGGNCFVVRISGRQRQRERQGDRARPKQAQLGGYTAASIAKGATANKTHRALRRAGRRRQPAGRRVQARRQGRRQAVGDVRRRHGQCVARTTTSRPRSTRPRS